MAEGKGLSSEIKSIISQTISDLQELMDRGNYETAACIGYVALTTIKELMEGATDETDDQGN